MPEERTSRAALWGQWARPEWEAITVPPPALTPAAREQARQAAAAVVGASRVGAVPAALMAYSYDATGERHWPDAVVTVATPAEVGRVLAAVAPTGISVIARGAGTNLSGGTVPLYGGLVLALQRLQAQLAVDAAHLEVRAEVGWVNAELQAALAPHGVFFPPDPSSHRISTIGGNIAENSGGPHCVKYGVTVSHVLAVSGYLVDGTPLTLDRPVLPGDVDLLGVVVGSEGTLMVVTEATLALRPLPVGAGTALLSFPSPEAALATVSAIVAAHLEPSGLELLDAATIRLVEPFAQAGYPLDAGAVLLVEVEGDTDERAAALEAVEALALEQGAISVRVAATAEEAERLWIGRRVAYGALARQSAHVFVQDVTVPRPELAAMLTEVNAIAARHGLTAVTVAHAGDGNLHPTLAYDPADPDQVARLKAADAEILAAAAARDGSITGEHGVGIDKLDHLPLMYSADERERMAAVKRVFDPQGRLNPGKAIWTRNPVTSSARPGRPVWQPVSVEEVAEAVVAARAEGLTLAVQGSGRRGRRPGQPLATAGLAGIRAVHGDNLTVTVAAGTRMAELVGELAARGLEWPVSPWWPEETVGGVVAAGWPVFLEAGYGPLRDQVLGVTLVDGQGVRLRFGRPVVKNVAGYDLTKLAVGSAGRLGVLVELVLRLRPLRALTWRCWAGDGAPTEAAWEALARPDRPFAVVAAPDGLWTGWTRDPGRSWGGEGPDPRMSWRDALEELLAAGAVFADVGRGAPPPPGTRFWWPETGVAVGEFQADAAGVRRRVAWGAWAKASTPAADRLAEAVIRAFDPDAVFSARPEPPRKE